MTILIARIVQLMSLCSLGHSLRLCAPGAVTSHPSPSLSTAEPGIPMAKSPMKVLLVVEPSPFSYVSGYTNRFQEMLKQMKEAGDEVHIMTPDVSQDPPTEFCGFPITTLPGFRLPMYKPVVLSLGSKTICETIEIFKPDIVHVSTPGTLVYRTISAARKKNVPLVMSYHTHLPAYAKRYVPLPGISKLAEWLVRLTHSYADLTLVTSPELKKELDGIGVRRTAVWEKGVNTEVFSPTFRCNETKRMLSQGRNDSVVLLYVGRLGVEKNLDILKQALDNIQRHSDETLKSSGKKLPDVELAFIGTGPSEESLKELFKGYRNVYFAGQLSGHNLSRAFASADIFVMPSESETLGFVVLEALASGIPAVAVGAGGVTGIVRDNVTGLLSSPTGGTDAQQFSENCISLISDPVKRRSMGLEGRRYAEKLSWKSATQKLRHLHYPGAIRLQHTRKTGRIFDSRNLTAEDIILNEIN